MVVQSTAEMGALFTALSGTLEHSGGVPGSGSLLLLAIGASDTTFSGIYVTEAVFSGIGQAPQEMNLAREISSHGNAFPSLHIFSLTGPAFAGTPATTGVISVNFNQTVSNINAVSACLTGVNTTALGYNSGSFVDQISHNITSVGVISGAVSTAVVGDLLVDAVVANAGLPDDHTLGNDQTLIKKVDLNDGASSALSLSYKLAVNLGDVGMVRSNVTALETVTSTAFVVYMN